MFETTKVKCPSCGAGLQITRGATSSKCEYCGETALVQAWGGHRAPPPLPPGSVRPQGVVSVASGRQLRFMIFGILIVVLGPVCGTVAKVGFEINRAFGKINDKLDL